MRLKILHTGPIFLGVVGELAASRSARRDQPGSYKRILFVDDDPDIRATFARALSSRGFLVDLAESTDEAFALIDANEYPVVATDLSMPSIGGIEFIRRLLVVHPKTLFVVVTGQEDVELPSDAEFRGQVCSIVRKPFEPEQVVETIHRALRLRESRSSVAPPPHSDQSSKDERTLLIEDDEADAALMHAYFAASGQRGKLVRERRLSAALTRLEDESFDMIISDLALPDARGLDAVLRIQNATPDIPLVIMSGLEDDEVALQAVQAGAQDFLIKGNVDPARLQRSLRYARERKRSEQNLLRLAQCDPLTNLANRAHFRDRLDHTIARVRRSGELFAVMFVDLDDFKPINDQHGHALGDAVLVETGERLRAMVREYDTVARLGGDEFAIILDNIEHPEEVSAIAERTLDAIRRPHMTEGIESRVTASIGVAFYPAGGSDSSGLIRTADRAMYDAKKRGRNRFVVAGAPTSKTPLNTLVDELKLALERREFVLHYQPQIDAKTGSAVAAEALLRWNRGGKRLVMPNEFLHLLEESDQIRSVGRWVLRQALSDLASWRSQGAPIERISVNVSVKQLQEEDLTCVVRRALREYDLSPSSLELEITESSVMQNPEQATKILADLKDWGVRIAMDDFGTGHSSLSYLYKLPLDIVKIDRSFVRDLMSNPQCRAVTQGTIAMAKRLGLCIVAEGVETEEQASFVREEGCDILQGYLYGRPQPASHENTIVPAQREVLAPLPPLAVAEG